MFLKIYTDGSCLVHTKNTENGDSPGGWAFCALVSDQFDIIVSGGCKGTTNNRMELTAVIEALKEFSITENGNLVYDSIEFFSDSQLTINCASGLWRRKVNLDLWSEYDELAKKYKNISWTWVKAHNNDKYNDIVDILSRKEAKKIYMKN